MDDHASFGATRSTMQQEDPARCSSDTKMKKELSAKYLLGD
jgi:hypothetical protein